MIFLTSRAKEVIAKALDKQIENLQADFSKIRLKQDEEFIQLCALANIFKAKDQEIKVKKLS